MAPQPTTSRRFDRSAHNDRIIVIGGSDRTLDLLRVATIRSENIVLIGDALDETVVCFAARFAVETRQRRVQASDIGEASSLLVSIGDIEAENAVVRAARRRGIPIFVSGRVLVSDFRLIDFLEQRSFTAMAA